MWVGRLRFEMEVDGQLVSRDLEHGASVHVPPGTIHRMTAIDDCDVLEVSTPELDDVVRIEDRYGRVPETPADD